MTRRTVARAAESSGTGLHTGAPCRVRIGPGPSGAGITFWRDGVTIPARLAQVVSSERRTALEAGSRRVDTVEHLLAAVTALGIDDLLIDLDGPEVPIHDGSFAPFVALLDAAGVADQPGAVRVARLERPLEIVDGEARYRIEPADRFGVEVTLEYAAPVIGRQVWGCEVSAAGFRSGIAAARTYGFLSEVDGLRRRELLRGASPACAIVLSDDAVLNTTLRWPDEFARHKAGDLIGDLALLDCRLALRVRAIRPSHRGNVACARAIAASAGYLEA